MRRVRAAGAVLMLGGAALLVVPGISGAQEAEFGSFALKARAPAIDMIFDDATQSVRPIGQGSIPEAVSTLEPGPVGRGFSAVFWPGPAGGNLGSAIVTSGGPPEAEQLNSPIRAEASTSGQPDAKFDAPGVVMTAHADGRFVTATGAVNASSIPGVVSFGSATGTSKVELKDGKATAESVSRVTDLALGPAGLVRIDSVLSVAKSVSDAKDAVAEGRTVVSGVTIAGQPATIDENGVRFSDSKQPNPLGDVANQAASEALKQAGMTITVSKPVVTEEGPQGDVTAGSLVFGWDTGQGQYVTVAIGGASAAALASPGFGDEVLGDVTDAGGSDLGALGPSDVALGSTGAADPGGAPVPPTDAGAAPPPAGGSGSPAASIGDADPIGRFKGTAPALVLLAAGAALFAAGAMRRLPDNVLAATGTACNLGDDS